MTAVAVDVAPVIRRAAPSLIEALDITHSNAGLTYWELWDTRDAEKYPRVAKYAVTPEGKFLGGVTFSDVPGHLDGFAEFEDFLQALREIEARA